MTASDQDDWIPARPIGSSARGKSYGPQDFHLASNIIETPILDEAMNSYHANVGGPTGVDITQYLSFIKQYVWNWFDANRERKLGTFKVIIFNFTLKVKHCEALIELILGERV